MQFTEITKSSIAEKIAIQLVKLIKTKELLPGEKLPAERDLAQMMNVSRPSLREALRALAILKIIEIRQGDGIYVTEITTEDTSQAVDMVLSLRDPLYVEVFESRKVIELGIMAIAASKITNDQICQLEQLVSELEQNIHFPDKFIEKDLAIHNYFVKVADNKLLEIFMNSMIRLGRESRDRTTGIRGVPEVVVDQHKEILNAVKKHDQASAVAAMANHLNFLEEKLKS